MAQDNSKKLRRPARGTGTPPLAGESRRPSALMKVASSLGTTDVDSSLEEFIAKANQTLLDMDGWGIQPDDKDTAEAARKVDEARREAESQKLAIQHLESELERARGESKRLARKLADAEARAAAAEVRAEEIGRVQATATEISDPFAQDNTALDPRSSRSKAPWLVAAGAFVIGAALMFGATKYLGNSAPTSATAEPPATAVEKPAPAAAAPTPEPAARAAAPAAQPAEPAAQPAEEPAAPTAEPLEEPAAAEVAAGAEEPAAAAEQPEEPAAPAAEPEKKPAAPVVSPLPPETKTAAAKPPKKHPHRSRSRGAHKKSSKSHRSHSRKRGRAKKGGIVDPFAQ